MSNWAQLPPSQVKGLFNLACRLSDLKTNNAWHTEMTIFVECHCGMFSGIAPPPKNKFYFSRQSQYYGQQLMVSPPIIHRSGFPHSILLCSLQNWNNVIEFHIPFLRLSTGRQWNSGIGHLSMNGQTIFDLAEIEAFKIPQYWPFSGRL